MNTFPYFCKVAPQGDEPWNGKMDRVKTPGSDSVSQAALGKSCWRRLFEKFNLI